LAQVWLKLQPPLDLHRVFRDISLITEYSLMADLVIQNAIQSGAPLYNAGEHGKCADIYIQAARQLLSDPKLNGELDASASHLLSSVLRSPAPGATALAWQLRRAFDVQLARVKTATIPATTARKHYLRGTPLCPPFPAGFQVCTFGAGCFWGTEKGFWRMPGVYTTAVGYCGGHEGDAEPTYEDVCSGTTGHNEVTQVVWDPSVISFADILRQFWRCHNPTQGNRQGNDRGSQYRSGIYCSDETQVSAATASLKAFDKALRQQGFPAITTEVRVGVPFHYAEDYHQQYLAKPRARQYCSAEPTGISLPAFDNWPFEGTAGAQAHAQLRPKLPEAFWATYDSSIRAPNEPVELSPEALATAVAEAEAAEKVHTALLADAERKHAVIVSFCGGCGFAKRAEEFDKQLRSAAGVEVGLVKDVGITGNFDVKVRQPDGSFHVVHSKKAGDGFVDSEEKLQHIIRALQIARPHAASADPSKCASKLATPAGFVTKTLAQFCG